VITVVLCAAVAYIAWPLLPAMVLGAWFGAIARPLAAWLTKHVRGRSHAAAAVTTALVLAFLVPLAALVVQLATAAVSLFELVRTSATGRNALEVLVTKSTEPRPQQIFALVREYAGQTWTLATTLLSGVSGTLLRLLVLVMTTYASLAHGDRIHQYLVDRVPLPRRHIDRMRAAFDEAGQALLVGMGGTALLQGIVASVAFVVLDVPNALTLGALTVVCAFVPVVGTGLVWVPVAIGLLLAKRWVACIAMLAVGAGVIGVIDNIVRPVLTRRAAMRLPASILLVTMIGGLLAFGFAGLLLGPLAVRLATEVLDIHRDERLASRAVSSTLYRRPAKLEHRSPFPPHRFLSIRKTTRA
jgi:predicted PurR-regulated permease PerM